MFFKNHKLYAATFISNLLSDFGDTLYSLALLNYVLLVPEKEIAIALVGISESLPIVFSIFLGYWADRTQQKVLAIIRSQLFRFLLYLGAGFLLQFNPALILIISLIAINFFSDLAGKYENSLFLPIQVQLLPESERQEILATSQGISSGLSIAFQLVGAIVVTWISYSQLAFLNATTFLAAAFIMIFLRGRLGRFIPVEESEVQQAAPPSFLQSLKKAWEDIKQLPQLHPLLISIASANGIVVVIITLMLAMIATFPNLSPFTPASTVVTMTTIISLFSIIGNILVGTIAKNIKLGQIITSTAVILPLLFLSLLVQQIWLIFACLALIGIMMGLLQPKMQAYLLSILPIERLALLSSSIATFVQATNLISQLAMSFFIVSLPIHWTIILYLGLAVLLLFYLLRNPIREDSKQ